jgi:DNA-binding NtrC family response regulator
MSYNFSNVKVLVIEDSQPMTDITVALLKGFGCNFVQSANNADRGYALFVEEKHDLILVDWLVKPINGLELSKKIRMDSLSPDPFVPIVLMTGFSERKRVMQARDTGVTEFLAKPFTANDLYKKIDHIIMKPRQFVKSPDFFGPDRRRKIVEDENLPQRRAVDKDSD